MFSMTKKGYNLRVLVGRHNIQVGNEEKKKGKKL